MDEGRFSFLVQSTYERSARHPACNAMTDISLTEPAHRSRRLIASRYEEPFRCGQRGRGAALSFGGPTRQIAVTHHIIFDKKNGSGSRVSTCTR